MKTSGPMLMLGLFALLGAYSHASMFDRTWYKVQSPDRIGDAELVQQQQQQHVPQPATTQSLSKRGFLDKITPNALTKAIEAGKRFSLNAWTQKTLGGYYGLVAMGGFTAGGGAASILSQALPNNVYIQTAVSLGLSTVIGVVALMGTAGLVAAGVLSVLTSLLGIFFKKNPPFMPRAGDKYAEIQSMVLKTTVNYFERATDNKDAIKSAFGTLDNKVLDLETMLNGTNPSELVGDAHTAFFKEYSKKLEDAISTVKGYMEDTDSSSTAPFPNVHKFVPKNKTYILYDPKSQKCFGPRKNSAGKPAFGHVETSKDKYWHLWDCSTTDMMELLQVELASVDTENDADASKAMIRFIHDADSQAPNFCPSTNGEKKTGRNSDREYKLYHFESCSKEVERISYAKYHRAVVNGNKTKVVLMHDVTPVSGDEGFLYIACGNDTVLRENVDNERAAKCFFHQNTIRVDENLTVSSNDAFFTTWELRDYIPGLSIDNVYNSLHVVFPMMSLHLTLLVQKSLIDDVLTKKDLTSKSTNSSSICTEIEHVFNTWTEKFNSANKYAKQLPPGLDAEDKRILREQLELTGMEMRSAYENAGSFGGECGDRLAMLSEFSSIVGSLQEFESSVKIQSIAEEVEQVYVYFEDKTSGELIAITAADALKNMHDNSTSTLKSLAEQFEETLQDSMPWIKKKPSPTYIEGSGEPVTIEMAMQYDDLYLDLML